MSGSIVQRPPKNFAIPLRWEPCVKNSQN